jgi:hypothetical protein
MRVDEANTRTRRPATGNECRVRADNEAVDNTDHPAGCQKRLPVAPARYPTLIHDRLEIILPHGRSQVLLNRHCRVQVEAAQSVDSLCVKNVLDRALEGAVERDNSHEDDRRKKQEAKGVEDIGQSAPS